MTETYEVGLVDEFPVGKFKIVQIKNSQMGVLREPSGNFRAIMNVCPHYGAPICQGEVSGTMLPSDPGELVYGMENKIVRCPWHNYEFSLETGECLYVSKKRIKLFPVYCRDGKVHVEI